MPKQKELLTTMAEVLGSNIGSVGKLIKQLNKDKLPQHIPDRRNYELNSQLSDQALLAAEMINRGSGADGDIEEEKYNRQQKFIEDLYNILKRK